MRFLISLQREGFGSILPINYQYELSSLIDRAESAFSEFLHRQGYVAYGKKFRMFTFSRIQFDRYQVIIYFLSVKAIFSRSWTCIVVYTHICLQWQLQNKKDLHSSRTT